MAAWPLPERRPNGWHLADGLQRAAALVTEIEGEFAAQRAKPGNSLSALPPFSASIHTTGVSGRRNLQPLRSCRQQACPA
jgi:hypothetical protein